MTIPFHENWILATLRYISPSIYRRYEFCNYQKAIERGIGLCSQHAIAITDFLNQNDIETKLVGLDGHVVVTSRVSNDEWWVLDPDFGVVIPYSIEELETSPKIIEDSYRNKLYNNSNLTTKEIADIYGKYGNIIYPTSKIGNVGYIDCNWKKVIIERVSYVLKWLLPLFLVFPLLYPIFHKRHG